MPSILVIEDDPRVRSAIVRMLKQRGYQVLAAGDGDEAVAAAASVNGALDLILSDVVLPGASGPEIVDRVRLDARGARALFMSGRHDHPALPHFIAKPFTPEALARKLREVLDG